MARPGHSSSSSNALAELQLLLQDFGKDGLEQAVAAAAAMGPGGDGYMGGVSQSGPNQGANLIGAGALDPTTGARGGFSSCVGGLEQLQGLSGLRSKVLLESPFLSEACQQGRQLPPMTQRQGLHLHQDVAQQERQLQQYLQLLEPSQQSPRPQPSEHVLPTYLQQPHPYSQEQQQQQTRKRTISHHLQQQQDQQLELESQQRWPALMGEQEVTTAAWLSQQLNSSPCSLLNQQQQPNQEQQGQRKRQRRQGGLQAQASASGFSGGSISCSEVGRDAGPLDQPGGPGGVQEPLQLKQDVVGENSQIQTLEEICQKLRMAGGSPGSDLRTHLSGNDFCCSSKKSHT
jgi:hypothetical protein